jgi:hypothetical protein
MIFPLNELSALNLIYKCLPSDFCERKVEKVRGKWEKNCSE